MTHGQKRVINEEDDSAAVMRAIVERIAPHVLDISSRKINGRITLHFGQGKFEEADLFVKI